MIRKFKNGNVELNIKEDKKSGYYTEENIENFVHGEMFMNDLMIEVIGGFPYIVDYNTERVYDLPRNHGGLFLEDLWREGKIKLYPYGKREGQRILKEL